MLVQRPRKLLVPGLAVRSRRPPFSREARVEAGSLLRRLQEGELLKLPGSRPMPSIGPRCHELRVQDENRIWRVVYRIDPEEIVVVSVFSKTTRKTLCHDIENCKKRLRAYDLAAKKAKRETRG